MSVPYLKQMCYSPSQWRGVNPEHLSICSSGALAYAQLRLAHLGATLVGYVFFFNELLCLQ